MAELVTLVNRSTKTLKGVWDGRQYDLEAGKKYQFPRFQAEKFRDQNPVFGTLNKYTGEMKYLVGIEEDGDDVTPIEQTTAVSLEDLSAKIASGELRVVQGNGYLTAADRGSSIPLPTDGTGFMKP
jgi:hypothetical protein